MNITIKYTGQYCTLTGKKKETLEVETGKTLDHLIDILGDEYDLRSLLEEGTLFLINDKIAKRQQVLSEGDEVHVFQMMAGG